MDGGTRIWDYFKTNNITSVVDSSKTATMQLVGPIEEKHWRQADTMVSI